MPGEVISAVPALAGLFVKSACGVESGSAGAVTKGKFEPLAEVVQPTGSAGAATPSKFSKNRIAVGLISSFCPARLVVARRKAGSKISASDRQIKIKTAFTTKRRRSRASGEFFILLTSKNCGRRGTETK